MSLFTIVDDVIPFDVNKDGVISMADANMIVKQYLGCEPDNIDVNAADINNDGSITIADANLLHNYILGRIVNIKLNKTSLDLMVGSSETLTAEFSQMTPTDNPCTWSTSDTSIATVDNNGKVTAIKGGTAIITCAANDDVKVKTECVVTVKKYERPVIYDFSAELTEINDHSAIIFSDGAKFVLTGKNVSTDGKIFSVSPVGDITIDGKNYEPIKLSNGAENVFYAPANETISSVTIYSFVNADSGDAYWKQVGTNTYNSSTATIMKSFKDADSPDVQTFELDGVSSFVLKNTGKQPCIVLKVIYE